MSFVKVTIKPYLVSIDNINGPKKVIAQGLLVKLKTAILNLIETCFWENSNVLGFSPVKVDKQGGATLIIRFAPNSRVDVQRELRDGPFEDTIYEGESAMVKTKGKSFFVDFRNAPINVKPIDNCKNIPSQLFTPSWLIC